MEDRELLSLRFLFLGLIFTRTYFPNNNQSLLRRRWREHSISGYRDHSHVRTRTMRRNRTSTTNDHHRRRLSIRNFLNDFRRQSSVHDYKLVWFVKFFSRGKKAKEANFTFVVISSENCDLYRLKKRSQTFFLFLDIIYLEIPAEM